MKTYNCSNCGDTENEIRAVETREGVMCEECAIKFHTQVLDENKIYGALNMMELLIDQHRDDKLHLRDLVRSLDRQLSKIKGEMQI